MKEENKIEQILDKLKIVNPSSLLFLKNYGDLIARVESIEPSKNLLDAMGIIEEKENEKNS